VTLTWLPATQSQGQIAVGYNIYRGTQKSGPYALLISRVTDTKYIDELVNSGVTYYYVLTSVDENGRESKFSEEIIAKVP
jgi:fibronectin type 3 domain-containing protein